MPKLNDRLPKYRHHKASGRALVTLDGKDHYLGEYETDESKAEYDRLIALWLSNGRAIPRAKVDSPTTVEELLAAFWQHTESYYVDSEGKPTSEVDSYRQVMKPLRALYGPADVATFGPNDFKVVRQTFIDRRIVRTSINQRMGRVKRIFRWGVENEMVPADVIHKLDAVAGLKQGRSDAPEREPILPVSDEHIKAIEPYVSPQVWAMVRIQRLTGMRPGEVTRMRPCDIDQSDSACWEYRPSQHKNAHRGHDRVVFLCPPAQEVIRPFLRRSQTSYCFSPKESVKEQRNMRSSKQRLPVSPSKRALRPKKQPGERYETSSYGRAISNACAKAGIPSWAPNRIRHTVATEIRRKYGLDATQVFLGHKNADVTQVYTELDLDKAREIAKTLS